MIINNYYFYKNSTKKNLPAFRMQTNQKYELRGGGQQTNMSIMAAERWMRATTLTSLRSAEQRHIFRLDADLTKKKRKKKRHLNVLASEKSRMRTHRLWSNLYQISSQIAWRQMWSEWACLRNPVFVRIDEWIERDRWRLSSCSVIERIVDNFCQAHRR